MKNEIRNSTRVSQFRRSGWLCLVFILSVCATMIGSSSACTYSISGTACPDKMVGGTFGPSKVTIVVPVTTLVSGGGSCGTVLLTGGSVHVDLLFENQVRFSGDGNIAPGVGSQSQNVNVVVTISPKPNPAINCQVRHSGVAYFSDGGSATYGPVGLYSLKKFAASKSKVDSKGSTAKPKQKPKTN